MTHAGRAEIIVIAAIAVENRVIGRGLRLPWHLPEDLKRFKRLTYGCPVIVGRRTWRALQEKLCGPLPGRRMLVLSRTPQAGAETFTTLADAIDSAKDAGKVFIGGGSDVYAEALPLADTLELTLVDGLYQGDVFFPPYEHLLDTEFRQCRNIPGEGLRFATYYRKRCQP